MTKRPDVLFARRCLTRRFVFGAAVICLLGWALLSAPGLQPSATASAMFATITVTTTADTVAADGQCSLREAIQAANTNLAVNECPAGAAGLDTIEFNLGAGTPTINLTGALPAITQAISINGNTGGATRVELNGAGAGSGIFGLMISASGSTVQALVINRVAGSGIGLSSGGNTVIGCIIGLDATGSASQGNTTGIDFSSANNTIGGTTPAARNIISGNGNGIVLTGASAANNIIQGNYIGTDVSGTVDLGNTSRGIFLNSGPHDNLIGGTAAGAGNLISGNNQEAIQLSGNTTTANLIQGNLIGTNAAGTAALGNRFGPSISNAPNNTIGGTVAGARNIISGNSESGVNILGSTAANNIVQGNFIGTDINGTADVGNGSSGVILRLGAHDNLIGGTAAGARNIISGNNGDGIRVTETGTANNTVQGNYIGTDVNGTADLGNSVNGVSIDNGAQNMVIGGTAAGAGNLISGNTSGVSIFNSATANLVQGNLIGTNAAGTAALGNSSEGVFLGTASTSNTIGGTAVAARNIISGNGGDGINVNSGSANVIQGNYIGTDVTGALDLGNTGNGIQTFTNSHIIGGTAAGAGNLISGNNTHGINLSSSSNQVQGNLIGVNAAGTGALGNTGVGVLVGGASNTIGGTTASARNIISASGGAGIQVSANNNNIQGNFIGTDISGAAGLGNTMDGVLIGSGAQGNSVGGTAAGAGNLIAFNTLRAVNVTSATTTGNRVLANSIFSNGGLGIDLGNNGVTANDVGDTDTGPNNLQNFPVLLSLSSGGGNTTVVAALNSTASTAFRIEFFSSPSCDVSGNGEGQVFLGFVDVTTNADGNAPINAVLPGELMPGHVLTMTATDAAGNTSEFSRCAACSYAIAPSAQAFQVAGGTNNVNVTSMSGCPWTAVSNDAWITINSGASGFGNGAVNYTVAANAGASARVGSITVAGRTFFVSQAAVGVLISTDFSGGIPPGWIVVHGGTGNYPGGAPATWTTDNPCNRVVPSPFVPPFAIVDSECAIQPATQDEQLITPPFDATGLGQVVLQFDNQFRWFAGNDNEVADVDVTTNDGQNWINVLRLQGADDGFPTPNTKTINLTTFIAGSPANVRVRFHYYVTAAPLPISPAQELARHDTAEPNVPVAQEISWIIDRPTILAYTIGPVNQTVGQNGGSGQVTVQAAASAAWTAQSNVAWIMLSGSGGTGVGSIEYQVAANSTGVPRTGTATIASNTFTVMQDGSCPAINLSPATLPNGAAGTPYNQTLTASGGNGPYSFALSLGSLPNGVSLSGGGELSGTPTAFGTFNFTVRATDANNCGGTRSYELVINPACAITVNPSGLPAGTVGTAYNQTLTASGGTVPYSFTVSAGALPGGLNLSSGGALSGVPVVSGTFTFTIRATDAAVSACTGERQYMLMIAPSGGGLQFYPLPSPVRLLETRAGFSGCANPGNPINANDTFTLPARTPCAGIPANAAAVTGNITVVPSEPGFLTLFPSTAAQPQVANSNFAAGEITNNVFTVGLGAGDGAFKIFTNATTHIIADVTGYYAPPGTNGLYFHPLATPVRLLETRTGFSGCIAPGTPLTGIGDPNADPNLDLALQGRSPIPSPCNSIPATAQVLVGNATSVLPSGGGYLTIYPSGGTRPTVASSNYAGGDVINGPFAVKLGADGKFKIYTFATTHLVVDILGYYSEDATDANGAGLFFNPLPSPVRLLETRPDFPGFPLTGCTRTNAPIPGNLVMATHTQPARSFCGLPATAQAVVGNVSVVNSAGAGFLTLFPGNLASAPLVATSNYPAPATFGYNRHYFVGLSPADGTFKVLTQFTTDLILDASGYFAP